MLDSQTQRDSILRMAKNLKNAGFSLSRIYVKKDVHPAVRKEAARLRHKEREEKDKSENVGVNIVYDWKNRVMLRDGVVIDRFTPNFFLVPVKNNELRLCSWNIGDLKDKLQDKNILMFVLDCDIVWILETKKYFNIQVPGFTVYRND